MTDARVKQGLLNRICNVCQLDKASKRVICSGCLKKHCRHTQFKVVRGLCEECRAAGTPSRTGESVA